METLYSGLDRDDVVGIGSALREAGIPFDVNADGATVLVAGRPGRAGAHDARRKRACRTAAASATSCSTSSARWA